MAAHRAAGDARGQWLMIDDEANQIACRAKLVTLAVATTGAISLAASATGGDDGGSAYIRTAGSFISDGLRAGMEVKAAGFTKARNNGAATVTDLTSTIVTVSKPKGATGDPEPLLDEAAAGARSLVVGLPEMVSWENKGFDPEQGRVYLDEQYLPGPVRLRLNGMLEALPMYVLNLYVPRGVGISADSRYSKALRALFKVGTRITLPDAADDFRVRADVAPTKSQRQFTVPGFVVVTFSIPLFLLTLNN
jgi:Bacteriophage related domain of unknown function